MKEIKDLVNIEDSVTIGENVKIYPPCIIGGDSVIEDGATIYPNCYILDSHIAKNVCIYHGNFLEKAVIGERSILFPNNFIKDSEVAEGVRVSFSHIEGAEIERGASIGPFARLRTGAKVGEGCKVGDFVEIKNSTLGSESKASHLSYIGDCSIGRGCNIGCGAIFVNYDGKRKWRTNVGDNCFIGSNCNIISPVEIEKNSYICAGTTITEKVEEGDFVIGRKRAVVKKKRAYDYLKERV